MKKLEEGDLGGARGGKGGRRCNYILIKMYKNNKSLNL